jgi:hypothetical protein
MRSRLLAHAYRRKATPDVFTTVYITTSTACVLGVMSPSLASFDPARYPTRAKIPSGYTAVQTSSYIDSKKSDQFAEDSLVSRLESWYSMPSNGLPFSLRMAES